MYDDQRRCKRNSNSSSQPQDHLDERWQRVALHDEVLVLLVLERQRAQCARRRPLHLRGLVGACRIGKKGVSQKQCTTSLQMPCIHTRLCKPHAQRVLILLNY